MQQPVMIHLDEVPMETHKQGDAFEAVMGSIAPLLGAKKLGYRLMVVPPGKKAWPYHSHHMNEEMFFILEGMGLLRYGDRRYPIRAGDVIAAPPGGPDTAHQIINDSHADLKYLCVSTMEVPEVMEYPDSNKFGVYVGTAPGGDKRKRTFSFFGRRSSETDYWDGEKK